MKYLAIIAALSALVISGCGSKEEAAPETSTTTTGGASSSNPPSGIVAIGYDKGTKKVGDKGVCAVCMVKEGKETAEEDVKLTLDYKDKTYVFCNQAEEAEFISDPKKYTGL